jgi:hypothetical protein
MRIFGFVLRGHLLAEYHKNRRLVHAQLEVRNFQASATSTHAQVSDHALVDIKMKSTTEAPRFWGRSRRGG